MTIGNFIEKTAINAGKLKYDDLIKNINRIYEATPWYDKLLMGVKNINDMSKFYDEIIKGNYGTVLTELSFELKNPFRGFILTLKESNSAILIADLVVLPEYRKQGLGTLLVKKVLNKAYELGYKKAFLAVTDLNPAKQLYTKLGFKLIDSSSFLVVR